MVKETKTDREIIYIKYPSPEGFSVLPDDFTKLHSTLKSLGYRNLNIQGPEAALLRLQFRYCVVCILYDGNKIFIDSSKCYDYQPIPMEEFLHSHRGIVAANKFNL